MALSGNLNLSTIVQLMNSTNGSSSSNNSNNVLGAVTAPAATATTTTTTGTGFGATAAAWIIANGNGGSNSSSSNTTVNGISASDGCSGNNTSRSGDYSANGISNHSNDIGSTSTDCNTLLTSLLYSLNPNYALSCNGDSSNNTNRNVTALVQQLQRQLGVQQQHPTQFTLGSSRNTTQQQHRALSKTSVDLLPTNSEAVSSSASPSKNSSKKTEDDRNPAAAAVSGIMALKQQQHQLQKKPKVSTSLLSSNVPDSLDKNTKAKIAIVPCRARGMSVKHNFQVSRDARNGKTPIHMVFKW
jgi:hypothetical protein